MMEDVEYRGDFYEDDEPVGRLLAAYEGGQEVVTVAPPIWNVRFGADPVLNRGVPGASEDVPVPWVPNAVPVQTATT